MKNVLVGLAVLAMAGTVLGAVNYTVTGPGGVSAYNPAPGEVFNIVVSMEFTAGEAAVSWQAAIAGPEGWMTGANPGVAVAYDNTTGWDASQGLTPPANQAMSPQTGLIGCVATDPFGQAPTSGQVFTMSVVAPAVIVPGEITLVNAVWGNLDFIEGPADAVFGLMIPEPVSALLLLAGLPMLRRRR